MFNGLHLMHMHGIRRTSYRFQTVPITDTRLIIEAREGLSKSVLLSMHYKYKMGSWCPRLASSTRELGVPARPSTVGSGQLLAFI